MQRLHCIGHAKCMRASVWCLLGTLSCLSATRVVSINTYKLYADEHEGAENWLHPSIFIQ